MRGRQRGSYEGQGGLNEDSSAKRPFSRLLSIDFWNFHLSYPAAAMGFWLDTFPAGSVRLLHLRSEMEKGIGEVKPVLAHPASLFDISWHPGTSTSLTTFNINSWMIFEKDGSTTPSASPAGLFSFTADLSSGLLVSVSAGATDHASLLDFMTSAAQSYPHLDREALCRLAIQNSYESAAELVRHPLFL